MIGERGPLAPFIANARGLVLRVYRAWLRTLGYVAWALPIFILFFLLLVVVATLGRQEWPFALRAQTRYVELHLPSQHETIWRLGRATVCVRDSALANRGLLDSVEARLAEAVCGKGWSGFRARDPETAVLLGNGKQEANGWVTARAVIAGGQLLTIELNRSERTEPTLHLLEPQGRRLPISKKVLLVWDTSQRSEPLVLPFTASARIGQDVNFARTELTESGTLDIFSPSDQILGGRALVQSFELTPGDRIEIGSREHRVFSRGFFRFDPRNESSQRATFEIVAYGPTEQVRVHRLGDKGLAFQPSLWSRLLHNNGIVIGSLVIFGLLSLLAGLAEALQLAKREDRRERR